jgi:hypothetical protein
MGCAVFLRSRAACPPVPPAPVLGEEDGCIEEEDVPSTLHEPAGVRMPARSCELSCEDSSIIAAARTSGSERAPVAPPPRPRAWPSAAPWAEPLCPPCTLPRGLPLSTCPGSWCWECWSRGEAPWEEEDETATPTAAPRARAAAAAAAETGVVSSGPPVPIPVPYPSRLESDTLRLLFLAPLLAPPSSSCACPPAWP